MCMQETTHLRLRFDQVPHQMITIWSTANGTDRLMCWQTAPVSSRQHSLSFDGHSVSAVKSRVQTRQMSIPDYNDCSACLLPPPQKKVNMSTQPGRGLRLRSFTIQIYSAFLVPLPPLLYSQRALDLGFYKASVKALWWSTCPCLSWATCKQ